MCYTIYKAICLEIETKLQKINIAFISDILLSFFSVSLGYVNARSILYTVLFMIVAVQYFIFFCYIVYFYTKIRRKIIEIKLIEADVASKISNIIAGRIYGYPLIFLILISTLVLLYFQLNYKNYSEEIMFVRCILFFLYPVLNSIFYGFTKSSIQSFITIFKDDDEYTKQQKVYFMLREKNMLYPRYIYNKGFMKFIKIIPSLHYLNNKLYSNYTKLFSLFN